MRRFNVPKKGGLVADSEWRVAAGDFMHYHLEYFLSRMKITPRANFGTFEFFCFFAFWTVFGAHCRGRAMET